MNIKKNDTVIVLSGKDKGVKGKVLVAMPSEISALRELDDPSIHKVYARCPVGVVVAYAVQNRLKKAAAFHIIDAEVEE